MRSAAQLAHLETPNDVRKMITAVEDDRFDLRVGLEHITQYVYRRRHDDQLYRKLYEWISLRRKGRGDKSKAEILSPENHLLFVK